MLGWVADGIGKTSHAWCVRVVGECWPAIYAWQWFQDGGCSVARCQHGGRTGKRVEPSGTPRATPPPHPAQPTHLLRRGLPRIHAVAAVDELGQLAGGDGAGVVVPMFQRVQHLLGGDRAARSTSECSRIQPDAPGSGVAAGGGAGLQVLAGWHASQERQAQSLPETWRGRACPAAAPDPAPPALPARQPDRHAPHTRLMHMTPLPRQPAVAGASLRKPCCRRLHSSPCCPLDGTAHRGGNAAWHSRRP